MDIPVTLILSYIFVGIMPLYAINLDAVFVRIFILYVFSGVE